jgi:hypothetical protein
LREKSNGEEQTTEKEGTRAACRPEETRRRPKAGSGSNRQRELNGWSQDEHLYGLRGCSKDQLPFHKDETALQLPAQRRLAAFAFPGLQSLLLFTRLQHRPKRGRQPMRLKDWEVTIQTIIDECHHEHKAVTRILMEWRANLEKEPSLLQPFQIDEIVREVRRRLGNVT